MSYTNLNLAEIVYRVMTSHRGWAVEDLKAKLGIKDRAYRKYRLRLQQDFTHFLGRDGSRLQEVTDGDTRYLRLVDLREHGWSDADFVARVAALHFASRLLGFARGTEIGDAIEAFLEDFRHTLRDRKEILTEVLGNADRMFYEIPDAPKDYADKGEIIHDIVQAMLLHRRIDVDYDSASLRGAWKMTLEPLTLATHRSALYLFARARGYEDIRIYAVDRFISVALTDDKFEYPSSVKYDPDTYVSGAWGVFRGDGDGTHEFELLFADKRYLKMFLQERRWHESQQFEELDDGRLRMTFETTSDREVWPWIRGFGDDVEVVAPSQPPTEA